MKLTLGMILASCAYAQLFPFPGPGRIAASGGGGSTPAFVQGNICQDATSGPAASCAFSGNVTSGNLLVIVARWQDASNTSTISVDNLAGTACSAWSTAVPKWFNGTASVQQVLYCVASSTGALTPRFTADITTSFRQMAIMEYSGVAGTSPLDVVSSSSTGGTANTACTSGATAALAASGELAIGGCLMWDVAQSPWGAVTNFTNRATASSSTLGVYDSVRSDASAVTFATTVSSDVWAGFVAVFKQAP